MQGCARCGLSIIKLLADDLAGTHACFDAAVCRGAIFGNLLETLHGRSNRCVDSYISVSPELSSVIKLIIAKKLHCSGC